MVKVDIQTAGADALWREFGQQSSGQWSGPLDDMYRQWGARYLGFTRRRFVSASRGDGTWAPLSKSTIRARRAGKVKAVDGKRVSGIGKAKTKAGQLRILRGQVAKRRLHSVTADAIAESIMGGAAILRDTGTLLNALTIGSPGNLLERIEGGVRVGYAATSHAGAKGLTVQEIAGFHNTGGGRLPQRLILAEPSPDVVAAMIGDTRRAMQAIATAARPVGGRR